MGATSRILDLQDLILDLYGEGESLRQEVRNLREENESLLSALTYAEAEIEWLRIQIAQARWAIDRYRALLNK